MAKGCRRPIIPPVKRDILFFRFKFINNVYQFVFVGYQKKPPSNLIYESFSHVTTLMKIFKKRRRREKM